MFTPLIVGEQARKPRSYASSKLWLTRSLTGVKCRATSVAKNHPVYYHIVLLTFPALSVWLLHELGDLLSVFYIFSFTFSGVSFCFSAMTRRYFFTHSDSTLSVLCCSKSMFHQLIHNTWSKLLGLRYLYNQFFPAGLLLLIIERQKRSGGFTHKVSKSL